MTGKRLFRALLDDHAYFVQALLDLYEADFEDGHLRFANELTVRMRELFEDENAGGYFDTTTRDSTIVMRLQKRLRWSRAVRQLHRDPESPPPVTHHR